MFRNQARGLAIRGTDFRYLTEGAYSVVFSNGERVIKLFKSDKPKDHCTVVFGLEIAACAIAMGNRALRELVPQFYGIRGGLAVDDRDRKDVTSEFYNDLAYELEFVPGNFVKIVAAPKSEQERVVKLFQQNKINHMTDPSIILRDGRIVKVIDFAVAEVELEME
jgi:hypothetical protein